MQHLPTGSVTFTFPSVDPTTVSIVHGQAPTEASTTAPNMGHPTASLLIGSVSAIAAVIQVIRHEQDRREQAIARFAADRSNSEGFIVEIHPPA